MSLNGFGTYVSSYWNFLDVLTALLVLITFVLRMITLPRDGEQHQKVDLPPALVHSKWRVNFHKVYASIFPIPPSRLFFATAEAAQED